ncbi:ABC transporter permease [Sphingobacteriales bacterium UPWRP_1]|nr:ABC transporter permease [Sphingobacteriales bacterium TSM_CSM]PSJ72729.1 ABC transporter permease [Sphingobacteriales bacterium UPWRP_1]
MKFFYHFGKYLLMMRDMLTRPENLHMYWKELLRQMNGIGVGSLIIIGVISLFVGAVTALQFAYQMGSTFFPDYLIGYIVRDTMIIELAPTLSGLVLAGKVGSNMASELGTMRISEQIDALEIMGVNPNGYLIMPKIIAAIFIVPPLIVLAALLGIYGGYWAAENYGISPANYQKGLLYLFDPFNVVIMTVKSVIFAFLIASVACYQGFYVKGGALDIGRASTRAVVYGSILVIFFDYIVALVLT